MTFGPGRAILLAAATAVLFMATGASTQAQSLWLARGSTERGLITNYTARQVGDILTVVVDESQSVSDDGRYSLSKDIELDSFIEAFDLKPETFNTLPALKYTNNRIMDGESSYEQAGRFTTTISAVVIDVQPNGNLLVEGRRNVQLDGEYKQMRVRGLVRPVDISADNRISSTLIANGDVFYETDGDRSRATDRGWFERIMDFIWPL